MHKPQPQPCSFCPHPLDDHAMLMPSVDEDQLLHAGIINCPSPGCDCIVTWAATWHADGGLCRR